MAYDLDVNFAEFHPVLNPGPDEYKFDVLLYSPGYGSFGYFSNHSTDEIVRLFKSYLREALSKALTDYLKAGGTKRSGSNWD